MNLIWFSIKDGIAGIGRSKLTSFLTILSMTISLFLLGVYLIFSQNIFQTIDELKGHVSLEAFIGNGLSESDELILRRKVQLNKEIASVKYVSKEEALKKFKEEFSDEFTALIENNPLPASYNIQLKSQYLELDKVQELMKRLRTLPGISDVVYRDEVLSRLTTIQARIGKWFVFIGGGLAIISFVLIWTNIKLTVKAKSRMITTMSLVGAKKSFIKGPFYVQASIEGFLAGLFASALSFWLLTLIQDFSLDMKKIEMFAYISIVLIGVFYGILGCFGALYRRI